MATGYTTTDALQDSLPSWISSARVVRLHEGIMSQLVDKPRPPAEGEGINWNEISIANLTAQAITETTDLDENPQQLADTLLTVTPTMVGIHVLITDRTYARISKNASVLLGGQAERALLKKIDQDGITVLDGATTSLCGAGTTLHSGYIRAAVNRISSNATEPGNPPFRCVLHGYQIKDIEDEIIAGIGTYPVGEGLTARVFSEGFRGMIGGAQVYEDGNIDVSSGDAKGGVFAQEGIVLIQELLPKAEIKRQPNIGGGANSVYHSSIYAYGERSAGAWLYEIYSDATPPTS